MNWTQRLVIGYFRVLLKWMTIISPTLAARHALNLFFTPWRKKRQPPPKIFTLSEPLRITTPKGAVRGYRWNHPAPLKFLILHGFESCAFNLEAYVNPMIQQGYEVIAIDAPAHGASEGKRLTLPDYTDAIAAADRAYGPFDACMGHSFGALALCSYLERKKDAISGRMALIAPATETVTAIAAFFRFLQLGNAVRMQFDQQILELSGHAPEHFSLRRIVPALSAHRFLWVHDEEDDLTPLSDVRPLIDSSPEHVRFFITQGLGHRRIYRDDKVRQEVIRFLCDAP